MSAIPTYANTPPNPLDLPIGGRHQDFQYIPAPRIGAAQDVSYNASGGSVALSTAFGALTQMVQVTLPPSATGTGARIAFGANPNPSSTGALIITGSVMYYRVYPGEKIGVISNDSTTGALNIVECATLGNP